MMKRFIKTLTIFLGLMPVLLTIPASAATTNDQLFSACDPTVTSKQAAKSPICQDRNTTTNPVNHTIKVAADIVAIATGIAAVVFIILGGFSMITSAGNAEAVANARKRITYAVVGLVVVALAWTLISFVTDRLIK